MSGLRNLFKQYPSKSSELSGSDVEKEYKSRIESFVYEVTNQGPKSLKGGGDLLEKLFQWSQDAHNDRTWFRSQYQNELEARKGLEEECRKLKRELSEKRDQILAQEDQILAQEDQIRNLVLDHSKKLADEKGRHKIEVEKLRKEHMDILAAMEKDHQKVKRILDAETNRLRGELLVNVGEAKAWTDDTLRSKLITLQTKVQAITTVNGFKLDNTVPCSPHLEFDATQFLKRSDGTKVRVFLRNAIWSVLYDHFFARPFGFGVLGPVSGKDNPLLCALISWQSAIDGTFLHSNCKLLTSVMC